MVFDKEVEESLNPLNRTGGRSPTPPRSIFHQDFTRMKAATSRVFFIHLFFLCNSSSSLAYIVLLVQGIIYSVQSIQPSLLNINMINRTAPSQILRINFKWFLSMVRSISVPIFENYFKSVLVLDLLSNQPEFIRAHPRYLTGHMECRWPAGKWKASTLASAKMSCYRKVLHIFSRYVHAENVFQ